MSCERVSIFVKNFFFNLAKLGTSRLRLSLPYLFFLNVRLTIIEIFFCPRTKPFFMREHVLATLPIEMQRKQQQLRVDSSDGNAYPLDSFLEFYGEDEGQRRWATAGQQAAYTGISLLHVEWLCVSINVPFYQPGPLPLGLFLPVSVEPYFLHLVLTLALSVAPLPILLSLHSLLASLLSSPTFHVALVV
jgi:hypothetical protein